MNTDESPAGAGITLKAAGLSLSNAQKAKVPVENSEKSANIKAVETPSINDPKIIEASETFKNILMSSEGVENHVRRMELCRESTEYVRSDDVSVAFQYMPYTDVIFYNPNADNFELYDMNYVQAHELSHRMDKLQYKSFENPEFASAISECRKRVEENASEIQKWFEPGGKHENSFALSDIISALSNNQIEVPVGHGDDYWGDPENVSLEIFANISAIDVLGSSEKEEAERLLKEIYEAYKEIVR